MLVKRGVYIVMVICNLLIGEEVKVVIMEEIFNVWVDVMKFDFVFLVLV